MSYGRAFASGAYATGARPIGTGGPPPELPPGLRSYEPFVDPDLAFALADEKLEIAPLAIALYVPTAYIVNIGQAIETDFVQGISKLKTTRVNQVTEIDVAQSVTSNKLKLISQVNEIDLAQAISKIKIQSLGQVNETDLAQNITSGGTKIIVVGQVTETDLAQIISKLKSKEISQVIETDLAQVISRLKTRGISQVNETDLAQNISKIKVKSISQVTETDSAQNIFWTPKNRLVATTLETDTVFPITIVGIISAKSGLTKLWIIGVSRDGVTVDDSVTNDN